MDTGTETLRDLARLKREWATWINQKQDYIERIKRTGYSPSADDEGPLHQGPLPERGAAGARRSFGNGVASGLGSDRQRPSEGIVYQVAPSFGLPEGMQSPAGTGLLGNELPGELRRSRMSDSIRGNDSLSMRNAEGNGIGSLRSSAFRSRVRFQDPARSASMMSSNYSVDDKSFTPAIGYKIQGGFMDSLSPTLAQTRTDFKLPARISASTYNEMYGPILSPSSERSEKIPRIGYLSIFSSSINEPSRKSTVNDSARPLPTTVVAVKNTIDSIPNYIVNPVETSVRSKSSMTRASQVLHNKINNIVNSSFGEEEEEHITGRVYIVDEIDNETDQNISHKPDINKQSSSALAKDINVELHPEVVEVQAAHEAALRGDANKVPSTFSNVDNVQHVVGTNDTYDGNSNSVNSAFGSNKKNLTFDSSLTIGEESKESFYKESVSIQNEGRNKVAQNGYVDEFANNEKDKMTLSKVEENNGNNRADNNDNNDSEEEGEDLILAVRESTIEIEKVNNNDIIDNSEKEGKMNDARTLQSSDKGNVEHVEEQQLSLALEGSQYSPSPSPSPLRPQQSIPTQEMEPSPESSSPSQERSFTTAVLVGHDIVEPTYSSQFPSAQGEEQVPDPELNTRHQNAIVQEKYANIIPNGRALEGERMNSNSSSSSFTEDNINGGVMKDVEPLEGNTSEDVAKSTLVTLVNKVPQGNDENLTGGDELNTQSVVSIVGKTKEGAGNGQMAQDAEEKHDNTGNSQQLDSVELKQVMQAPNINVCNGESDLTTDVKKQLDEIKTRVDHIKPSLEQMPVETLTPDINSFRLTGDNEQLQQILEIKEIVLETQLNYINFKKNVTKELKDLNSKLDKLFELLSRQ